ncbi:hypothetical protein [Dolichospermum circinale]|nr:hypothetical protein [Dolichospermum circinale]MDB9452074.1 hypothetical protein [Dolichospermum circinale CS-547]
MQYFYYKWRSLSLYIRNAIALNATSIMRSLFTLHQKCDRS